MSSQWAAVVIDDVANQPICEEMSGSSDVIACVLPGRAANEAPHAYHVGIFLFFADQLAPPFLAGVLSYGDYTVGTQFFTSAAPITNAIVTCTKPVSVGTLGQPDYHFECHDTAIYEHVSAIKEAKLDFPAYSFGVTTAPAASATFVAPPNLLSSYLQIGAMSWDSGDDGL